jgi:hypothetical protein
VISKIRLPIELSTDLHRVRVAAVSGFDLAYARIRFVGKPKGQVAQEYGAK